MVNITFISNVRWTKFSHAGERNTYRARKTQFLMVLELDAVKDRLLVLDGWLRKRLLELDGYEHVFSNWTVTDKSSRNERLRKRLLEHSKSLVLI